MSNLKFTGTFTKLKKLGYTFMKLYARNYKVYNKDMGSLKLWVWVANGGTIEINDLYNNSKGFIEAMKLIDWSKAKTSKMFENYTYAYIRYTHCEPEKGFKICYMSKDIEAMHLEKKETGDIRLENSIAYSERVMGDFDCEKVIVKSSCEELLKEIEKIQNC